MRKIIIILFIVMATMQMYSQNVGIGTNNPLEKLSVGSTSQFRVDVNGNIIRINNVPYSFPSAPGGAGQLLINDGNGNLTWANIPPLSKPVVRQFAITNNGISSWFVDQPADYNSSNNSNPGLVLYRGLTYQFVINAPGHPFLIALSVGGPGYTVGITNNGTAAGVVTFTVPMDAPDNMVYYCTIHSPLMNGVITIR